jgi:condensation domain-containing protein/N-acetylmuramoyl-L-alanine amidase-like protein/phosphopantetheine binding protein
MTQIAEHDGEHAVDRDKPPVRAPLSGSQRRLWYMSQLHPENPFYNVTIASKLEGRLDTEALRQTLRDLVQRHEILRTRYPVANGQPLQEVVPLGDWQVQCDVRLIAGREAQDRELQDYAQRIARREILLDEGPVFRAYLLSVADDCHGLVLLTHHIAIDQQSINVLMDELEVIYEARLAGDRPNLPLTASYREFSAWQNQQIERRDPVLRAYWGRLLVDPPRPLPLPREQPGQDDAMRLGREHRFQIDAAQTLRIRSLCRRTRTTPSMVLLAVLSALLSRYTARRAFFVGTTTAFRASTYKRTIGCFINTLALPIDVEDGDTFENFLLRTRSNVLDAFTHHELPYERLIELARLKHPASGNAFVNTYFQFQPPALASRITGSKRFKPDIHVHNGRAKFALMLNASDRQTHIDCTIEYDAQRFNDISIQTLASDFHVALLTWLDTPSAAIGDCPIQLDTRLWVEDANSSLRSPPAAGTDVAEDNHGDLPPTESKLAELWFDLLGKRPTRSSSDFAALGGHSLLTAQLAWRIRETFAVDVRIADLQRSPGLADMARLVAAAPPSRKSSTAAPQPASRLTMLGGLPCHLELGSWKLEQLDDLIAGRGNVAAADHLHRIAWAFAGTPFQFETRRPLPVGNRLPIRLGAFDCFTFVLTVLALAAAGDINDFARLLAALRYKDSREQGLDSDPEHGTIFDFAEEALLVNAVERGLLLDVTPDIAAGSSLEFVETQLSPVRRAAELDPLELWATPKLGRRTISAGFIPHASFGCLDDGASLRNGDIVLMSRGGSPGGQIIDHLGFVHVDNGQTHLLQSTRHFAYHPPPDSPPAAGGYTGIFYDEERRREQIGVGIGGGYLGDAFTLYQGSLPLFGYRSGERRLLSDYLRGAFTRCLVLRPTF